jgi:tRNA modification GTPase
MDLTEIEGLSDLIQSETTLQREQAIKQLNGEMKDKVNKWVDDINKCLAYITAYIDFGDDYEIDDKILNISIKFFNIVNPKLKKIIEELNYFLKYSSGEQIREGFQISIIGNVQINSLNR